MTVIRKIEVGGLLVQDGDDAGGVEEGVDKDGAEKRAAFFIGIADGD